MELDFNNFNEDIAEHPDVDQEEVNVAIEAPNAEDGKPKRKPRPAVNELLDEPTGLKALFRTFVLQPETVDSLKF